MATRHLVGLDIGSKFVKAVQLTESSGRFKITEFGIAEIPPQVSVADVVGELFSRKKFKTKRAQLLEILHDSRASDEAKEEARAKLQKLPRDASPVRLRNRCALTGRPRGVYRKFGLGRNKLRELALKGEVPGIIKASW